MDKAWRTSVLVLGLSLLLILVLYQPTTRYLGELWSDVGGEHGHGFLVLLISAYIIYTKRDALMNMVPCPNLLALVPVGLCSLLLMAAELASTQIAQVAALLLLILSTTWAVLGTRIVRMLLLPLLFISLALPLWSPLLPVLQVIAAEGAYSLTRSMGIPALTHDFVVVLPSGQLSIEHSCSGLRYLLAGVTLGVFYALLNYRRFSHRLLVVMTVAGAAILANILRIFVIIWLAWKTDMQHTYVQDHMILGWYLFGGLIVLLLVVDHFISVKSGNVVEPTQSAVSGNAGRCTYGPYSRLFAFLATLGLIATGPAIAW